MVLLHHRVCPVFSFEHLMISMSLRDSNFHVNNIGKLGKPYENP